MGDMLYSHGSELIRLQGPFIDTSEVEKICDFIGAQRGYESAYILPEFIGEETDAPGTVDLKDRDNMFEEAARLVVHHQQGSTSLIQRKLKLGYNRAGRLIDQLEAAGIVGPFEGSKAREVLVQDEYALEQILETINLCEHQYKHNNCKRIACVVLSTYPQENSAIQNKKRELQRKNIELKTSTLKLEITV